MEQQNQPQPPVFNGQQPSAQPAAPQYQPQVTATPMMDPITAVKTCLSKYFDFKGRARRSEYWWFVFAVIVVSTVFQFMGSLAPVVNYLTLIFGIATVIPSLAALTRRLHDVNRSGWWVLAQGLVGVGYFGSLLYMVGSNFDRFIAAAVSGDMEFARVMVDSVQATPAAAGVMACCAIAIMVLSICTLVFSVIDSKWGENKYGPSPKYQ